MSVRTAAYMATMFLLSGCLGTMGNEPRDSRLSCAVALLYHDESIRSFLASPGPSFVQAYVRFRNDLPDDVIFGIDQEFLDGVANPLHYKGGDWMSFVGVQRTGAVWVAHGSDATHRGTPSKERTWKIFNLGQRLKPNTWYKLRIEADFGMRRFRKFTVEGPGLVKRFDLSELTLDYPNYMPFGDRAMSFYVCAMRGRSLRNPNAKNEGPPIVYFDDVSGGPIAEDGKDIVAFEDSFEADYAIGKQPVSLPVIDLRRYVEKRWYLERDEALFRIQKVPFARSGQAVGVADASID